MLPKAYTVMSDVRDIAAIHVAALENEKANGKRFIVTLEKPYAMQAIPQILKSNGYDKVSITLAPTFLLNLLYPIVRESVTFQAEISSLFGLS
jgi:dihydroflavonol-4-reductase